jgi:diguanylate cyclase (GGDEF)-like protein
VGGLGFVLAADAYRARLRLVRNYFWVLLPLLIWFALAPLALRAGAAFTPGHLLVAGTLTAAGLGHLWLLRQARMLGAIVVGAGLIAIAGSHLWLIVAATEYSTHAVTRQTFIELALYLAVALGMQLMAFEDMTYELRMTNTQLADAQQELRQLVTTDALTGCRNRRYFDQVIVREMRRHHRYHIPLSLVFIDVDRFKAVNDTLGHEAGDRLLQRVAGFIIRKVREVDYVFRWGGDEFLILMSCREEEGVRKARELQAGFAAAIETEELPAGVGLSVGCVEVSPGSEDVMALVRIADERMYEDKKR